MCQANLVLAIPVIQSSSLVHKHNADDEVKNLVLKANRYIYSVKINMTADNVPLAGFFPPRFGTHRRLSVSICVS